ncbi:MAG: hypothetical protein R3E99_13245 [Burkholderiaceae bacterium]
MVASAQETSVEPFVLACQLSGQVMLLCECLQGLVDDRRAFLKAPTSSAAVSNRLAIRQVSTQICAASVQIVVAVSDTVNTHLLGPDASLDDGAVASALHDMLTQVEAAGRACRTLEAAGLLTDREIRQFDQLLRLAASAREVLVRAAGPAVAPLQGQAHTHAHAHVEGVTEAGPPVVTLR